MSHEHTHDENCDHGEEITVEAGVAGLVLSFAELSFAQIDFDEFAADSVKRQTGVQYLLGAVRAFADWEELNDESVAVILRSVVTELFPWDEAECSDAAAQALAAEAADDMIEAVARGNEAMQATLAATNSLADLVEGVEG